MSNFSTRNSQSVKLIGGNEMKQYRCILAGSIVFVIMLAVFLYFSERSLIIENLVTEERNIVDTSDGMIKKEIENNLRDLRFFAELYESHLDEEDESMFFKNTSYNFFMFIKEERKYDKIRFINNDGEEKMRINYNDGEPTIAMDHQLENQHNEMYVKETKLYNRGDIYLSPFELKKTYGIVEQPIKPMVHFATPVFNKDGERQGMIVLDYLANSMIEHFEASVSSSSREWYLLNHEGYYLVSPNERETWGFMYPNREKQSFTYHNPTVFNKMEEQPKGDLFDQGDLIVYKEVNLPASWNTKTDERLIIMTKYPKEKIHGLLLPLKLRTLFGTIIIIIGMFVIYKVLMKMTKQSIEYQKTLEKLVSEDSLTKVGNRFKCHQMMEEKIAKKKPFTLCYIDMDRFKQVNDTYGHAVGDELLIYLAQQFQKAVKGKGEVFRLGGDEFAIILNKTDEKMKQEVAEELTDIFQEPIYIEGNHCDVFISVGYSEYPKDGETIDTLITKADKHMYEVKSTHRRSRN